MHSADSRGEHFVLAICREDRRLWVHESSTQVNHLIPVTNFYNELMLHKNIRDPKIALDAKKLFMDLGDYSDGDLTYAFLTYNKIKSKVYPVSSLESDRRETPSFLKRLSGLLGKV